MKNLFSAPDARAGEKFHRRDALLLGLILLVAVIYYLFCTKFGKYLYGSEMDWDCQHSVFPDYFRKLFYSTGQLFPSFAPNIGAGENIFCFSYYGLLSPIVLLSYLLPFVEMVDYIAAASMVSVFCSVIFLYLWLRGRFDRRVTALLALLFVCCGPLLFHSHRHIMFVIYLPFLIAALHFVDVWFAKGYKTGLIVSVTLIIFTSYLHSVYALFALVVYGIFCLMERRRGQNPSQRTPFWSDFFRTGLPFLFLLLIAVLLAGVLLLPTALAIPECRETTNQSIDWSRQIFRFVPAYLTFNRYTMGLSSIFVFALISQIVRGRGERRFLAIVFTVLTCCPFLLYLLNAMMYIDGKVMIALLPLALILCGDSLTDILEKRQKLLPELPIFVLVSLWGILFPLTEEWKIYYTIDFLIVTLLLILLTRFRRAKYRNLLVLPIPAVLVVSCFIFGSTDQLTTRADYEVEVSDDLTELVGHAVKLSEERGELNRTGISIDKSYLDASHPSLTTNSDIMNRVYDIGSYSDTVYSSLHRKGYFNFLYNEMQVDIAERENASISRPMNLYFNLYMGNRYWISYKDSPVPSGYLPIESRGQYTLYENPEALPVGYATDRLMSEAQYQNLSDPAKMEALLRYTIVENAPYVEDFEPSAVRISCDDIFSDFDKMTETESGFRFSSRVLTDYRYLLPEGCEGKLVLIRFKVDNALKGETGGDRSVWINGARNVVTQISWKYRNDNHDFEYVLFPEGEEKNELNFTFQWGTYGVTKPEIYVVDPESLSGIAASLDGFGVDREHTRGDDICGRIHVTEDGYFNLSMLYGRGMTVTVDGVEQTVESVDGCFIGFPIKAGEHEIRLHYSAPGLGAGKLLSLIGLVGLIAVSADDLRRWRKSRARATELRHG